MKRLNIFVCKIPLLARRTRPKGQARATIGYLVYNEYLCSYNRRVHDSSIYMSALYEELRKSDKK